MSLRPLLELAESDPQVGALLRAVGSGAEGSGGVHAGVSAGLRPFLLAALAESAPGLVGRPLLCVAADDRGARDLATELGAYLSPRRVRYYPSRGTGYESHLAPPPHLVGLRIAALDALTGADDGEAPVVVASAVALAEVVPDASLRPEGFALSKGEEIDLGDVAELLAGCGYERVEQVTDRGQFAVRGGILDVFGSTEDQAARIELFGDEIESIRLFSTFTQRSLAEVDRIELDPAAEIDPDHRVLAEAALAGADGEGLERPLAEMLPTDRFAAFLDVIDPRTKIVVTAAEEIGPALDDHLTDVRAAIHDEDLRQLYVRVREPLAERAALTLTGAGDGEGASDAGAADGAATPADGEPKHVLRAALPVSPARSLAEAEGELERQARSGYVTVVAFERLGEAERARYALERLTPPMLGDGPAPAAPGVVFAEAPIADGFVSPDLRLAVIPYRRLVHRRRAAAPAPAGGRLASLGDLTAGEHVVHEDHGVARFSGFDTRTVAGITRDYLELEYRDGDKVLVPAEQLAKITRYVGGGEHPELSKLGGKRWQQMKTRARRAARELAGELINLYAERQARRGHSFSPDGEWQLRLERSFPFRETPDQLEAIEAVKADMESDRPMDRLICGDVGYGKTEVAIRAAQKALADSKQVMVLVPTTILATQHLGTFRERFRDFPYEIEMVSRLRKPAEVKRALAAFADGSLDVLIGTHRLLSRDVRASDLGLLVVDEEQRFGVKQKELLRQLKLKVDVLSMSATPIPRTMQMSLAGLRDISVIETPPEGRRPVRTYVGPFDEQLVAEAIRREVSREGQCFFLHNRIETLHDTAERLRALLPGVRFLEAHGRLEETELEGTMLAFLRGEADVLVATTIIESGLDVTAANTLIVERADHLGLAQAYQIRGRVGRSRERAYAYMLYPSEEAVTREAAARLATLADHTELGSGFRIAMRDLELRGAGDLLGAEQSGHVAAIGFELYVEMLDEAVQQLRAEGGGDRVEEEVRIDTDLSAFVPSGYVPYEAAKIDIHRRIAGARAPGELRALRDELRDRFGPAPEPVEALLSIQRARIELARDGARSLQLRGGRIVAEPLEFDSARVRRLRERIPEAIFSSRESTLSLRVSGNGAAEEQEGIAALESLADAVSASREAAAPAA